MVDFGKRARTRDDSPEKMVCAAIHWDDGIEHKSPPKNITTGWVIAGHRHHNCFPAIFGLGFNTKEDCKNLTQGFLTDLGNFVDRKKGGELAFKSGQMDELTKALFSEDLY